MTTNTVFAVAAELQMPSLPWTPQYDLAHSVVI
jgi:hypothetical protein